MWGFEFLVNLLLCGWGDWNEWESSVNVTQSEGCMIWGSFPGVLGPLSTFFCHAMGPGKPTYKDFINWLPCPLDSGWMVKRKLLQEIHGGKRVRQTVCLVLSLQSGQSSARCPSHTDFFDFDSNTHTFPSSLWPISRSDGAPITSPEIFLVVF